METNRAVVLGVACLPLAVLAVVLAGGCTPVPSAAASESPVDPSGRVAASTADGGAPAASARCRTDADCALSRRSPGNCCPSLCEPRPLTRAEASAEQARCRGHEEPCPGPACPPRQVALEPACVDGRCTVRRGSAAVEAR